MKKIAYYISAALFIVNFTSNSIAADLRYNSYTGEWQYTQPADVMKYNSHEQSWDYESPSSTMHYNSHSGKWSFQD